MSLAHYAKEWSGIGVDLSDTALMLAAENAERLKIDSVRFVKSDLTSAVQHETFDMIISNPPYISEQDMKLLDKRVRMEPRLALFGGVDGLDIYRRIAAEAPKHLRKGGSIYLEIGYDQGESVPAILAKAGFTNIEVRKDYAGHDRCVKGYYYV